MFQIIKKADIVLFVVLLLAGLAFTWFTSFGATEGSDVVVTVNGETYGTYKLSENQTVTVHVKNFTNKFIIKDGSVQMIESNCRNHVCIKEGSISTPKQSIVCLPHKLIIEIKGGETKYDAVSN